MKNNITKKIEPGIFFILFLLLNKMTTFYMGDNLLLIKHLVKSSSIDLIYMNHPFGTTKNKWDEKLDWEALFEQFFRVLKPNGMLVIHCSVPFNYELIRIKTPYYSWYWTKEGSTNPFLAKIQPLRDTEEILVWKKGNATYYPQKEGTEVRTGVYGTDKTSYYTNTIAKTYKTIGKYITHHLTMKRDIKGFSTRPKEMIELMIKSYTVAGDTILDPSCYKGLSGTVSKELGRLWIGIDKYFTATV